MPSDEHSSEPSASVVVVTGLSGAGRSTALRALEDLGFYCVDNLPPTAFAPCLQACRRDRLQQVALGIDVRVKSFLGATLAAIEEVEKDEAQHFTLLYLDASDATLLARYSATRRPHPLRIAPSGQDPSIAVLDGVNIERERLSPLRAKASMIVDTTSLTVHELRHRVLDMFRPRVGDSQRMLTRFLSFGFKYGAPGDVDMMFDVRFLDNPYFVPELRPLSGLDVAVSDYVRATPGAGEFTAHAQRLLEFLLPEYEKEGKSYLTVGFGCTGGRHRSVALAEWMAARLRDSAGLQVNVKHRDVARADDELRQLERAGNTAGGV